MLMIKTKVLFNDEARAKLLKGVSVIADAVTSTLGARGRNVAIARGTLHKEEIFIYDRTVIHDGVTVAKSIELDDETENMGVSLMKQAAQKQVDTVGDGTTVTILLASEIIKQSDRLIASGINPMMLRSGLESGCRKIVKALSDQAKPITTLEEKIQVATISAEERDLGEVIAHTIEKIGLEGIVTVEQSKSDETYVTHQVGMQIDRGYMSPYFVTDPEDMSATVENTKVLVTDIPLDDPANLVPLLQRMVKENKVITVIAPSFTDPVLALFISNRQSGQLFPLLVPAPMAGVKQHEYLSDIALLVGAKLVSSVTGDAIDQVEVADLGNAKRITATKDATLIVGGAGAQGKVKERIDSLRRQIPKTEGEYDRVKLQERLAKLQNGVAVLHVGGQTEIEMKERKERAEDAVHALEAAISNGIVPGGETIFDKVLSVLDDNNQGEGILKRALLAPFNKLLSNAGLDAGKYRTLLEYSEVKNAGVDVTDSQIKDMIECGIIDPVLVPQNAVKNAVSVAVQIITTGTVIVPITK